MSNVATILVLILCIISAVLWTICGIKERDPACIKLLIIPIAVYYGLSIGLALSLIIKLFV